MKIKRVNLCVFILILILLISICSFWFVKSSQKKFSSFADKTVEAYESGDKALCEVRLSELIGFWNKRKNYFIFMCDSDMVNEMSRQIYALEFVLKNQPDDFSAEISRLETYACQLDRIKF